MQKIDQDRIDRLVLRILSGASWKAELDALARERAKCERGENLPAKEK